MPLKNGQLTRTERNVADQMARLGSASAVAHKLGLSTGGVRQALARPAVQAEQGRVQQELLFSDILPLAVTAHKRILSDPKAPAGAVVQAIKLAYDRTLGVEDAGRSKEPHEMTGEELATSIATLERVASERARPVQAHYVEDAIVEPIDEPAAKSIFD